MSMMRYQFEDVYAVFCDEISMVGATKLLKINFRLQDLAEASRNQEYMGGKSFVASGMLKNPIFFHELDLVKSLIKS